MRGTYAVDIFKVIMFCGILFVGMHAYLIIAAFLTVCAHDPLADGLKAFGAELRENGMALGVYTCVGPKTCAGCVASQGPA